MTNKGDLISREALKKTLEDYDEYRDIIPKEVFDFIDNAPTVDKVINVYPKGNVIVQEKRPQGEITEEDIQNAIKAGYENGYSMAQAKYQRPQGEWLFTEVQPDYTVKGQCSICKERTRIGNYCRICGADMRGNKKESIK